MTNTLEQRVRRQFDRQPFMQVLGAELAAVNDGAVTIELTTRPELAQQHGFLHAGAVTAVLDTACGFAALTRMEPNTGVLTAEFKVNLLRPAIGPHLVARAVVIQAGRTLVVCEGRARMRSPDGDDRLVAVITATLACVRGRNDVLD